jgi:hypothetical protein
MPERVLELLTEPEAIAQWAPIPFELVDTDGSRLRTGTRARVRGGLAGRQLEFEVEIREAHDRRLALVATGPISIDAQYDLSPADGGSALRASVSVGGRGLLGGLLARAAEALLAAGALRASVARIGDQLAIPVTAGAAIPVTAGAAIPVTAGA